MKKTEVKVSFDSDKLSAIKQYMDKKDLDLQEELADTMSRLYDKYVPVAVREFIEFSEEINISKTKKSAQNQKSSPQSQQEQSEGSF